MRKQFEHKHFIDRKNDTLSLGGGGSSNILGNALAGAAVGACVSSKSSQLFNGVAGVTNVASGLVAPVLVAAMTGVGLRTSINAVAEADFQAPISSGPSTPVVLVSTGIGAGVGAGVGTVDALRHSGGTRNSSGRSTSSPARRF